MYRSREIFEKTGLYSTYGTLLKAEDKRLRIAVSHRDVKTKTIQKLFSTHSNQINAKFRTSGYLDLWFLCSFYENVPVYEVVDSVGALTQCEWRRLKKGTANFIDYELGSYEGFYEEQRTNLLPGRKERNKEAVEFIRFLDSLSGNTRSSVIDGTPFRLSDLPDSAKKSLQNTMQALFDSNGGRVDFSKIDRAKITIKTSKSTEDSSRYSEYGINVELENGQFFFTVDNHEARKRELAKVGQSVNPEDDEKLPALYFLDYHVEKDFVRRKQAIQLELMNKAISVPGQEFDMPRLLKYLLERYQINSVCDTPINTPIKNLSILTGPLWKVLDTVCQQLGKWQWECRATGMLVLRAPGNPYLRADL
ncbi:MAG: hypothetical protein QM758_01265 [Armatimonas sp.]